MVQSTLGSALKGFVDTWFSVPFQSIQVTNWDYFTVLGLLWVFAGSSFHVENLLTLVAEPWWG